MDAMPSGVLAFEMQMRAAPDASQWLERARFERRGARLLQAAATPQWWSARRPHPAASTVRHQSLAYMLRRREERTPPMKKIDRCPVPGKRSELWGAAPSTARFARAPFIQNLQDEIHADPTCGGLFGCAHQKATRVHYSRAAPIVSPLLRPQHEGYHGRCVRAARETAACELTCTRMSISKDVAICNVRYLSSLEEKCNDKQVPG